MKIQVRLYGILRESLPPEKFGRTVLDMPAGSTIADLIERLKVGGRFHVSVNEEFVEDWQSELHDGDRISCFPPSAGGFRDVNRFSQIGRNELGNSSYSRWKGVIYALRLARKNFAR